MNKEFQLDETGSVTSALGYEACGVTAGFKRSGAADYAVVRSAREANFAGGFTSCVFAAAPVQLCREMAKTEPFVRAMSINSGNANACTGAKGLENARATRRLVGEAIGVPENQVLVASTGRIGVQMPMELIEKGAALAAAKLSRDGGCEAARAIMTTDTKPKHVSVSLEINGKRCTIGAMSKGAGMIDPNMKVMHATMIALFCTDVKADNALLAELLEDAVGKSFNRITVDGDMSTNDTAVVMANAMSGVEIRKGTAEAELFGEALRAVAMNLARRMVMDGEGATKFVTVEVRHAASDGEARVLAEAVANSLLCKTAWYGNDPNWGRVIAALGYSGVKFDPDKVDVFFGPLAVVRQGGDAGTAEKDLLAVVKEREFTIGIDMNAGEGFYYVWTCDISHDYVKINADYHT
ncbi:MAG: bifunctional glutamate N-acetyltransferase/amino-acid acetyltransferase ArgJ [Victivallaceae bacterium]|nr:bifunctional glutamate N-acetyltransferase/amino-acid acetyltransferase ArgJ [Victivallaceae bacterium]